MTPRKGGGDVHPVQPGARPVVAPPGHTVRRPPAGASRRPAAGASARGVRPAERPRRRAARRCTSPTAWTAPSRSSTAAPGGRWGRPCPAGPLPWQLARGPDGSLLALSASPAAAWPLTRLGRAGAGWAARPVALPGPAREARLAGDGGRYAVVVDRVPGRRRPSRAPARAPLPADAGRRPRRRRRGHGRRLRPPRPGDRPGARRRPGRPRRLPRPLAARGPRRRAATRRRPERPAGAHRVVAVHAQTGAVAAVLPLDGVPVPRGPRAGAGAAGPPAVRRRAPRRARGRAARGRRAPGCSACTRPPWRSRASGPSTSSPRAWSWRPTATSPTPSTTSA